MSNYLLKKGQLEIMQTVFVVIIILVLLILGILFWVYINSKNVQNSLDNHLELDTLKKSQILNVLSELQCSFDNHIQSDCYDLAKIPAFQEKVKESHLYYQTMLGYINFSIVTVSRINLDDPNGIYNIYDNPKNEYINKRHFEIPINIYDPYQDMFRVGSILVDIYT
jgi:hypothetical protein